MDDAQGLGKVSMTRVGALKAGLEASVDSFLLLLQERNAITPDGLMLMPLVHRFAAGIPLSPPRL